MIGNILDHRSNPFRPQTDAVFEPTIHDDPRSFAEGAFSYEAVTSHPAYFHVANLAGTTVRDALLYAEATWPFPVTIYFYDAGSRPIG
jgi:hypothetical protein